MSDQLIQYPDHFRSGPLPEIFSIPDYDSFVFQLFLIKNHLDSDGITNCDIQLIGWVDTDDSTILGVPTYGVMYSLWNFKSTGDASVFPLEWIKSLTPKNRQSEVSRLAALWNTPEIIVYESMANTNSGEFISTNQVLLNEYFRYNHIINICGYSHKTEYLNIIERWTITLGGDVRDNDKDVIFSNRKLQDTYEGTKKMFEELNDRKVEKWVGSKIIKETQNWLNQDNPITSVTVKLIGRVLKLTPEIGKPFMYVFPADLLVALLERGNLEQLACVCLRYACILQQAQQWANCNQFYDILVNKYGTSIEGFASPLNTRIILQSKSASFCSLFPDVDRPFGSIGSFFDQLYVGKTASVCPPYTIYIFDMIFRKTLEQIEEAKKTGESLRLIYGLPDWHDVELIDFLESSEYVVYKKFVPGFEYSFFDSKNGSVVPATFANRYYILDIGNSDTNYADVFDEYFGDMKIFTNKLRRDKMAITGKRGIFDYSKIFPKIGKFEAVLIASTLVFYKNTDALMKQLDPGFANWPILFTYLLSEALLCLDPNTTRKYNKMQLFSFITKNMKAYL